MITLTNKMSVQAKITTEITTIPVISTGIVIV